MRPLVVALVVMMMVMISFCSAVNLKTSALGIEMLKQERRQLGAARVDYDGGDQVQVGYPGNSVNNHHYIPRQDFNNHGGDDSGNNGNG
ncbi:hypothetical protein PanWU01x14_252170 [Parasponia andersonii]|uniref:Uncharacterized protein n=1 Tax=Parasponia andersonii TaxID=3476 RepID=A0A2P5BC18_PARAD|nr:hypothetical protein PanWU01x14_252170 [Parasponia andersonii]